MNFLAYLNRRLVSAVVTADAKEFRRIEKVRSELVASNKRRSKGKEAA